MLFVSYRFTTYSGASGLDNMIVDAPFPPDAETVERLERQIMAAHSEKPGAFHALTLRIINMILLPAPEP